MCRIQITLKYIVKFTFVEFTLKFIVKFKFTIFEIQKIITLQISKNQIHMYVKNTRVPANNTCTQILHYSPCQQFM